MTNPKDSTDIKRLSNGNIQLKLRIPWKSLENRLEKEVVNAIENYEIPGFRKGKAPREIVEPKLNKTDLLTHAVQHLLPDVYSESVKSHSLKPILYPQISIDNGKAGEDWEFTATTCEIPSVKLPDYKKDVSNLKFEKDEDKLTKIIDYLRQKSILQIPELLVSEETNHRLSSLVENLTALGMDMAKYLETKKMTSDQLRETTNQAATIDLQTEFILSQLQIEEKLANRKDTLDFLQKMV